MDSDPTNDGTSPFNDASALLNGTSQKADRQRLLMVFHDLTRNMDSLTAKDAILLLAVARSAQNAAERNEASAKLMQTATARVEAAAGRNEASSVAVADSVSQRVLADMDAALDRRFLSAYHANEANQERQYKAFENRLKQRDPSRVAMWMTVACLLTCALTSIVVRYADDTARAKERAAEAGKPAAVLASDLADFKGSLAYEGGGNTTTTKLTIDPGNWVILAADGSVKRGPVTLTMAEHAPSPAPAASPASTPARIEPLHFPEPQLTDHARRALPVR